MKVKQVSEEFGVRYILEGSVQRSGDRVRITAQLIDALTGHHLWAERYDRDLKDLFALQDEVTLKILTAMQVKLTEGEQDLKERKIFQREERSRLLFEVIGMSKRLNSHSVDGTRVGRRFDRGGN